LYSAFRSEDTEALDAAQEDKVSLNRWVFKWRLKVRMFSHSRMSAGREFQVDGAATEKARWASSVCMRGTMSIGASEERRARGGARVCTSSLRYVGVAVVTRANHSRSRQICFTCTGQAPTTLTKFWVHRKKHRNDNDTGTTRCLKKQTATIHMT